jgi:hypothetical protein
MRGRETATSREWRRLCLLLALVGRRLPASRVSLHPWRRFLLLHDVHARFWPLAARSATVLATWTRLRACGLRQQDLVLSPYHGLPCHAEVRVSLCIHHNDKCAWRGGPGGPSEESSRRSALHHGTSDFSRTLRVVIRVSRTSRRSFFRNLVFLKQLGCGSAQL